MAEVKVPYKDEYSPSHAGEVLKNIFEKAAPVLLESQKLKKTNIAVDVMSTKSVTLMKYLSAFLFIFFLIGV